MHDVERTRLDVVLLHFSSPTFLAIEVPERGMESFDLLSTFTFSVA